MSAHGGVDLRTVASALLGLVCTALITLGGWLFAEVEDVGKEVVELRADVRHLVKTSDKHADRLDHLEHPPAWRYNPAQSNGR